MIHRDDANMHLFSESKKVLHQIDFVHQQFYRVFIYLQLKARSKEI